MNQSLYQTMIPELQHSQNRSDASSQIEQMLNDGVALGTIMSTNFNLPAEDVQELIIELAKQHKQAAPSKKVVTKLFPNLKSLTSEEKALEQKFEGIESEHTAIVEQWLNTVISIRNEECTDAALVATHLAVAELPIEQAVLELVCGETEITRGECGPVIHSVIVKRIRAQECA